MSVESVNGIVDVCYHVPPGPSKTKISFNWCQTRATRKIRQHLSLHEYDILKNRNGQQRNFVAHYLLLHGW